jgi:hypothetical protein
MIENGDINNAFWLGFLHLSQVSNKKLQVLNKKLYEHIKSGLLLLVCKDLLHSQIMVSENLILLQLASAILWMGLH